MKRASMEECPNCGARFRRGRAACPECGSDAETGWQDAEEIDYQSIEIPEAWDAEPAAPRRRHWLVVIVVLTVLALVGAYVVRMF